MSNKAKIEKLDKLLEKATCYKKVFETEEGKAVLLDLARKCYFDSPTLKQGESAIDAARKEGMRQAYFLILRELKTDTLTLIDMIAELNTQKPKKSQDFFNNNDDILGGDNA